MEKSHSVRFKLEGFSRVLLLGDAAHAFGPMLQNGAAQAFEDAYVIQDLLNEQINSSSVASFIDTFEKEDLLEYKASSRCLMQKFKLYQIRSKFKAVMKQFENQGL